MSSASHTIGTVSSTESLDLRRPALSIPAIASSSNRSLPPALARTVAVHNSAHNRQIPSGHLPIAARFARRPSLDSSGTGLHNSVGASSGAEGDRSAATRYRLEGVVGVSDRPGPGPQKMARDPSGETNISGTTAVDSGGEDTDASTQTGHVVRASRSAIVRSPFEETRGTRSRGFPTAFDLNASATSVNAVQTHSTFRHYLKSLAPAPPNKLHKPALPAHSHDHEPAISLPSDLQAVSETIVDKLLAGHIALSEKLRARYEEQFRKRALVFRHQSRCADHMLTGLTMLSTSALVRTLADVFTDQTWVVENYTSYVLHLENALRDIEQILEAVNPLMAPKVKKTRGKEEIKEQRRLARLIMVRIDYSDQAFIGHARIGPD